MSVIYLRKLLLYWCYKSDLGSRMEKWFSAWAIIILLLSASAWLFLPIPISCDDPYNGQSKDWTCNLYSHFWYTNSKVLKSIVSQKFLQRCIFLLKYVNDKIRCISMYIFVLSSLPVTFICCPCVGYSYVYFSK